MWKQKYRKVNGKRCLVKVRRINGKEQVRKVGVRNYTDANASRRKKFYYSSTDAGSRKRPISASSRGLLK